MKFFLLLLLISLVGCGSPASPGGGQTPTPPTAPTPPIVENPSCPSSGVSLVANKESIYFGFLDNNSPKEEIITIKNEGSGSTCSLNFSALGSIFTVSNNTCQGQTLASGGTCSLKITATMTAGTPVNSEYLTSSQTTISGSGGSNLILKFSASKNYLPIVEDVTYQLLVEQGPLGEWTSEGQAFDMGATLFVAQSLLKVNELPSFSIDIFSGASNLSFTMDYFQKTDDDGNFTVDPEDSDGILRDINFSTDLDLVMSTWERTMGGDMTVKEVLPSMPLILEQMSQTKDGVASNIFPELDNFLTSRRVSLTEEDAMMAQYAFIMDENRWIAERGAGYVDNWFNELYELALRDVYVLFDSLIKAGKTDELKSLSKAVLLHLLSNTDEIFEETGIVMKYSATPFNHSVINENVLFTDPLFVKGETCRMSGYVILIASLAVQYADEDDVVLLFDNPSFLSDINGVIKDSLWSIFYSFYIQDVNSDERANCLPVASLVAARSNNIATGEEKKFIMQEMMKEYNDFFYEDLGSSLSVRNELLEALFYNIKN